MDEQTAQMFTCKPFLVDFTDVRFNSSEVDHVSGTATVNGVEYGIEADDWQEFCQDLASRLVWLPKIQGVNMEEQAVLFFDSLAEGKIYVVQYDLNGNWSGEETLESLRENIKNNYVTLVNDARWIRGQIEQLLKRDMTLGPEATILEALRQLHEQIKNVYRE